MRTMTPKSAMSAIAATLLSAGLIAGCRNDPRSELMTADLERDLQLASTVRSTPSQAVSAIELGVTGGPSGTSRGQRGAIRVPRRAPVASHAMHTAEVSVPSLPPAAHAPAVITMTESAASAAPAPVVEPVAVAGAEHGGPYIGTSPDPSVGGGSNTGDWGRGRGNGG